MDPRTLELRYGDTTVRDFYNRHTREMQTVTYKKSKPRKPKLTGYQKYLKMKETSEALRAIKTEDIIAWKDGKNKQN